MSLNEEIKLILEQYKKERELEMHKKINSFYTRKRKSETHSILNAQMSNSIIKLINYLCKETYNSKGALVEHLIITGLENTDFELDDEED